MINSFEAMYFGDKRLNASTSAGVLFRMLFRMLFILSLFVIGLMQTESAHASDKKPIALQIGGNEPSQSEQTDADKRWNQIRPGIFGDRPISTDTDIIELEAPHRAFNGSRVPISMHAKIAQNDDYYIKKIYLVVDKNPLPLAGTFNFEANKGWTSIETEIRINEYTNLRVISETSDDELHMTKAFVKAVGGCSALPDSYDRSDANAFGRMDLSFGEPVGRPSMSPIRELLNGEKPSMARFKLIHPNASGMQFDQFSRTYIPAHFIHTIGAKFNGREIFTLDTNFSLSQDPSIGFNFVPLEDGEMTIFAIDSKDERFEKTWPIEAIQ